MFAVHLGSTAVLRLASGYLQVNKSQRDFYLLANVVCAWLIIHIEFTIKSQTSLGSGVQIFLVIITY